MMGYIKHSNTFMENIVKNYNVPLSDTEFISDIELYGDIRFKNVTFRYENTTKNVLDDINILVKKGKSIAIYGKSGSGKSTIIKLLMGFYKISSGEITLNDVDIKSVDVGTLRKYMSMVSQTIKIFEGTVIENILYGSNVTENELISKYSKQLRIFEKLKDGINTHLTINGSTLSGGQKQIISVLRAFIKGTPYLILDEPTVGLDKDTKKLLLDTVKSVKNKTVIYVTHDNDVKKYVDESYELVDGKIKKI
jgi:ATP-binding cassette subfamily B protein